MAFPIIKFINRFRSCLSCGIQVQITDEMFCSHCLQKVELWNGPRVSQKNKSVVFLYEWKKDRSPTLNALMLSLKNWNWPQVYRAYARKLVMRAQSNGFQFTEDTIIIPAPSRDPNARDHAYYLAKQISLITGCPLQLILKRTSESSPQQKALSRQGRLSLRFDRCEKFTQLDLTKHQVVFVDDVITTGSTARAAYQALGRPKRFHVWVIASRTSLAKKEHVLV